MWTSKIESVTIIGDQIRTVVSFLSDIKGEDNFNKEFNTTNLDQLKRLVQQKIDEITADIKFAGELSKLIGQPFDTTIIIVPDPAAIAREKYFQDLAVLNKMIQGIKDGVRKDTDKDYLDQLALVKSEFLPEYEKL